MKQLKVCLITDTWFPIIGGGPIVVLNYAKKLTINHNCKVDIITRRFNQQDNYHLEKIRNLKIIKFGPSLAWNDVFARLLFIVKTFLYLLSNNYDVVHAFPFVSGLPAWLYGLLSKKPIIFSIFALRNQMLENFLTFGLSYKLLITDNKEILKKYKNKNIIYLPNGVDIESFDKVKISKDPFPRLLFVGRFHKQKGVQNLLKIIKRLAIKFPTLKLVLIGYGSEENSLRSLIDELKIRKYVQIKPPMFGVDLIKEYKKSHLFVLPSLYEGQGIVVLEAWAAQLPIVATGVGSLKYIVRNGQNGYLVKANDSSDLIQKILKVLKNNKRQALGLSGYKLVKNEYAWNILVKKLFKTYKNLIANV